MDSQKGDIIEKRISMDPRERVIAKGGRLAALKKHDPFSGRRQMVVSQIRELEKRLRRPVRTVDPNTGLVSYKKKVDLSSIKRLPKKLGAEEKKNIVKFRLEVFNDWVASVDAIEYSRDIQKHEKMVHEISNLIFERKFSEAYDKLIAFNSQNANPIIKK